MTPHKDPDERRRLRRQMVVYDIVLVAVGATAVAVTAPLGVAAAITSGIGFAVLVTGLAMWWRR